MRRWRVYKGDASGGPVFYGSPVASVLAPPLALAGIAVPSQTRFGVRAFDDVTGYEEKNVDIVTELIVNAAGIDISNPPTAPIGLVVGPDGLLNILVRWRMIEVVNRNIPTSFNIYVTIGTTVDFSVAPMLTVPCYPGTMEYEASVGPLAGGTTYAVAVRSAIGLVEEQNTYTVTCMTKGTAPLNVSDLTVAATFRE